MKKNKILIMGSASFLYGSIFYEPLKERVGEITPSYADVSLINKKMGYFSKKPIHHKPKDAWSSSQK